MDAPEADETAEDAEMKIALHAKPEEIAAATRPQEGQADAFTRQSVWILAALLESLALVGGMWWVMSSPAGMSLGMRILLVSALAVAGAASFILVASRLLSPRP